MNSLWFRIVNKRQFVTSLKFSRHYYLKPKRVSNKNSQALILATGVVTGIFGFSIYVLGRPDEDTEYMKQFEQQKYSNYNPLLAYLCRARDKATGLSKFISDPSSPVLIPSKHPQHPSYTLVLEIKDLIIHPSHEVLRGWNFQKRPGVHAFLRELSQDYEIIVYSSEVPQNAEPIIQGLDPYGMIGYRLYRGDTKYMKGQHVKDLDCLNRDLSKLVILDTSKSAFQLHPNNGLALTPWKGDIRDRTLLDLIPFLKSIVDMKIDDVRTVIPQYSELGDNFLETFKKRKEELDKLNQPKRPINSNFRTILK
ncbi:Mitochondrial import inner membrane translocase subunit TIM50-A-like [Oopsacas minuta]|uniref:Mitochondrial import inner membrane translocase subunit TIM50 n=1 Tax=Oopsacas minuta TaxID=111878 RepID=A0AAV7KDF0_9METZ|nr:Mitochondrial import inner membrane translocase subunit TIM50-A-like [Oopsacas minuta]